MLMLGGCDPGVIGPPSLDLQTDLIPMKRIDHVTVRNGQGQVVMDTPVGAKGASVQTVPQPGQLDGKLVVETTWSNGEVEHQTIETSPGVSVGLKYDPTTHDWQFTKTRPSGEMVSVDAAGDYLRQNGARVGAGTRISGGGGENHLLLSPRWLDGGTFRFGASFGDRITRQGQGPDHEDTDQPETNPDAVKELHRIGYGGIYGGWLKGSAHGSEPIGGDGVAITYQNLMSPSGATGVNFGATGMKGDIDVTQWQLGGDFGCLHPFRYAALDSDIFVGGGLRYQYDNYEYRSNLYSLTFMDSFARTRQDIDQHTAGIDLNLGIKHDLSSTLSIGAALKVGLGYRWAELDSTEQINVPVNPVPADRSFETHVGDDDDGFVADVKVSIGLDWRITPQFSIGPHASFGWISDVPEVRNPASPSESATHLGSTDAIQWGVGLRGQIRF